MPSFYQLSLVDLRRPSCGGVVEWTLLGRKFIPEERSQYFVFKTFGTVMGPLTKCARCSSVYSVALNVRQLCLNGGGTSGEKYCFQRSSAVPATLPWCDRALVPQFPLRGIPASTANHPPHPTPHLTLALTDRSNRIDSAAPKTELRDNIQNLASEGITKYRKQNLGDLHPINIFRRWTTGERPGTDLYNTACTYTHL